MDLFAYEVGLQESSISASTTIEPGWNYLGIRTSGKIKDVVDYLEATYGPAVIERVRTLVGGDTIGRNYIPGVTPASSADNFDLINDEGGGVREETGFKILSLHGVPMTYTYVVTG